MAKFAELPWIERAQLIERHLPPILAGLSAPVYTADVAELLCRAIGTREKPRVSNMLVKLAPLHPLASQPGQTMRLYGRDVKRWVWSPGTEGPPPLEKEQVLAGVEERDIDRPADTAQPEQVELFLNLFGQWAALAMDPLHKSYDPADPQATRRWEAVNRAKALAISVFGRSPFA